MLVSATQEGAMLFKSGPFLRINRLAEASDKWGSGQIGEIQNPYLMYVCRLGRSSSSGWTCRFGTNAARGSVAIRRQLKNFTIDPEIGCSRRGS